MTGGGTGGHVVPNLAVIEDLRKNSVNDKDILYIGSRRGPEKKMVEKVGVNFRSVACGKLRRYFSWQNFLDLFKLPVGVGQAMGILRGFGADIIFSKGGFVSVPVVVAGWLIGVPIILHESDLKPGLANRICARFAQVICVSFEESKEYFKSKAGHKVVFTGNLVRENILKGNAEVGRKFTGLDKHRPVILVIGGSQGAEQINKLIEGSLEELLKRFQIVHVRGRGNLNMALKKPGYVQYEFLDQELADVYALAELVITRGGANSLAELALLKKKALVIPLSADASRGDQIDNSKFFARKFNWSLLNGKIGHEDFIRAIELAYENEINKDEELENGVEEVVKLILQNDENRR